MVLTTGKAIEDELLVFGMQCHEEHPVHSFIFYSRDPAYLTYNVFIQQELNEIAHQSIIKPPKMNKKDLRNYLNSYNYSSAEAIRQQVFANQLPTLSNDEVWIRNSMYNLLRVYEANHSSTSHSEAWYMKHVWRFVDADIDHEDIDVQ